jgi:hypothetical protein
MPIFGLNNMSEKTLHVITFDIPYPPNYGALVDIYYKLRSFKKQGIKLILHCYYDEKKDISRLKDLCSEIYLYKRKKFNFLNLLPFGVSSRISHQLIQNLKKDAHPILIEGIHSTGFLLRLFKIDRKIALRSHNVQHEYYEELAQYSNSFFKKLYYKVEANRFRRYEKRIAKKINYVFPVSHKDQLHLKEVFINSEISYASAFYNDNVQVCSPKNYILLQGNFEVEENKEAADYLLQKIVPLCTDQNFVIAGLNAASYIKNPPKNVTVVSSPNKRQMYLLNDEAKASIVYSNLNAGVKLKILNSLAAGVPVFCNSNLYIDPYLKVNISQYKTPEDLVKLIVNADRTTSSREERQKNFQSVFNLNHFASQIIGFLFK